jgi:hypothetical protein
MAPVRAFGNPVLDTVMPKPYAAHQAMFDPAVPHGLHYYWKSHALPTLTDASIDVIVEQASKVTSPLTTVPLFCLGGAVARVDEDATAYAGRDIAHDINVAAAWRPEDPEPERHVAWVREFYGALEPHGMGTYVNFMSDEPQDAVRRIYGDAKYARLVKVKTAYDPDNFFRLNQNIVPAT